MPWYMIYRIAGNFRWCKFSHKMKVQLRIKFRNLNFRNCTPLYSTHVRTTVYNYAVQATPTCAENKISKVFIFAHTARFRIMRKFAPFENFPLYGICDLSQLRPPPSLSLSLSPLSLPMSLQSSSSSNRLTHISFSDILLRALSMGKNTRIL